MRRIDKQTRPFAAVGAGALALAACASISPDEALAPTAVPGDWSAVSASMSGAAPVTDDWLVELSDPAVTALAAEAISYNNDLAAAGARVRSVLANARIVRSDLLPQVGFGLDATRTRNPGGVRIVEGVPFDTGGGYQNDFSSSFSLRWQLDVWGRLTDQTRAAYLSVEAQELDFAAAALSVAGNTAQAYYGLFEARLQRELAERDVEAGEANLRIVERRYERGLTPSLDVRLARASLAQSRAQALGRQQAEREAGRRLEVLLGRYPGAEIVTEGVLPVLSGDAARAPSLGDPLALLSRRPDVLSAERRLKAQGFQVSAARKAMLPSLNLTAFASEGEANGPLFDQEGNVVGVDKADFMEALDFDNVFARLIGGITAPIFQGGRIKAQIKAERSQLEASVYDYASTVLTAYREVEDAIAADGFLAAQLEARKLAFEESVAAEELTERQYLGGTTNIFNLISAQQRRIANEGQFIAASRARLVNRVDLYMALGAPFSVPTIERPGGERFTPPSRDPNLPPDLGSPVRLEKTEMSGASASDDDEEI